ncbi:MAG: OmpA family protein [Rhodobiaceae bacterium]|nr:OmpA family protein [Rhodobiaceae bacterium]
MKRGIFTTATAMALVLAQAGLPAMPGFSARAYAQTTEQTQEQPAAEQQAQEQPAAEQPAAEQPAPPPEPQPQPEAAEAPPATEQPAEQQQAEQAPAPEPEPQQQAAPEQPPAEPEPQQQAAPEQQAPAPEQQAEQPQQEEPAPQQQAEQPQEQAPAAEQQAAPEQTAEQPRKRKKPGAEQQASGPDASPQAAPLAEKPVEQIIEEAKEAPPAIVPDQMTDTQRQQLRKAEEKSREEARKRRRELLGAAAAGAAVGALVPLLGGRIVDDRGDRFVVERDGDIYVRSVDSDRFRRDGADVQIEQLRGGRTRETVTRRNGVQIITVRDPGGYVLRRVKQFPNGQRVVLFDQRDDRDDRQRVDYGRRLPPLRVDVPRDNYIVSGRRADRRAVRQTFLAPPVEQVRGGYTLRDVRENERLRDIVRRVDLDTITFAFGSAAVRASEVDDLAAIAGGMLDVIDQNPGALFLVEGHTDAVGSNVDNLILSDRRAESVARVLTDAFGVPPENMVTEGYGEQFLKVQTEAAEQRNRRVTIRNISPLLTSQN